MYKSFEQQDFKMKMPSNESTETVSTHCDCKDKFNYRFLIYFLILNLVISAITSFVLARIL